MYSYYIKLRSFRFTFIFAFYLWIGYYHIKSSKVSKFSVFQLASDATETRPNFDFVPALTQF